MCIRDRVSLGGLFHDIGKIGVPDYILLKPDKLTFEEYNVCLLYTSINHISTTIRVEGRVDFPLLQQSIQLVLKADATLRTRIVLNKQRPFQYTCLLYTSRCV